MRFLQLCSTALSSLLRNSWDGKDVQPFMTRTNVPTRSSATTSAFVVTDRSSRFVGGGGFSYVHTSRVGQQGFYSHSLGSLKSREAELWPKQAWLHTPNVAWPHSGRFCKSPPLCLAFKWPAQQLRDKRFQSCLIGSSCYFFPHKRGDSPCQVWK